MASRGSKVDKEREKAVQDKGQAILGAMLKEEDNKYCVDCDSKGPRWCSWNLGVFLCIRCAGIHRNLGVHISKVKSVNLDSWTPSQVASMQAMGNSKGRAVYEARLPEDFRRPQTDQAVEAFARQKYEKKKFMKEGWTPTKPPDFPVGWHQGEEAGIAKAKVEVARKVVVPARSPTAPAARPVITKPEPRPVTAPSAASSAAPSASTDLLGLLAAPATALPSSASSDLLGLQEFGDFTSAPPAAATAGSSPAPPTAAPAEALPGDLFTAPPAPSDPGKMSTDSIMALFGPPQPRQAPQPSYQPPAALQQFNPLGGLGAFPSQQPPQTNPANNPFLADAGLGGQLGGLNLGGASQAPLWQ